MPPNIDLNELQRKLQEQRNIGVAKDGRLIPTDPKNDGTEVNPKAEGTTLEPKKFFSIK